MSKHGRIDLRVTADENVLVARLGDLEQEVPFSSKSSLLSPAGRAALTIAEALLSAARDQARKDRG